MAIDTEKVRDAAIALTTSTLYAAQLEDSSKWASQLKQDFLTISDTFALTDEEFIGLPSILCQFNTMLIMYLAREIDIEPDKLWQTMVTQILEMSKPRNITDELDGE